MYETEIAMITVLQGHFITSTLPLIPKACESIFIVSGMMISKLFHGPSRNTLFLSPNFLRAYMLSLI